MGRHHGDIYIVKPKEASPEPKIKSAIEIGTRERNNFLRAILGMALAAYHFKPDGRRGEAIPEMVTDLKARGLSVSDDTLRKWLVEAVENVYDPAADTTIS
jgi:hypothetical protein